MIGIKVVAAYGISTQSSMMANYGCLLFLYPLFCTLAMSRLVMKCPVQHRTTLPPRWCIQSTALRNRMLSSVPVVLPRLESNV